MTRMATLWIALLAAAPAGGREVSGVEVPGSYAVGGESLELNGAGLRKKFIFKVYVGALYLKERSSDAASILAADAPWAVRMTFLRDVTRSQLMGAFREGFENNS